MTSKERDFLLLLMAPSSGDDVEAYRAALRAWVEGEPEPEKP